MSLTALITATVLKEITVLSFCDAAVPPPWVGTVLSAVLTALAVLTTALQLALA